MANLCIRLASLTYATEPESWEEFWSDIEGFRRRFFRYTCGKVPLVVVPEKGSLNGRKHGHLAVDRYVPKAALAELWGHGFVDIRQIRSQRGVELSYRQSAAVTAGYLTSYVKKGFTEHHEFGRHRYSVTKGYVPEMDRYYFTDELAAWACVESLTDGPVYLQWSSRGLQGWEGPNIELRRWSEPGWVG